MRLGHPLMRQAMSTLCRQLHDPTAHEPIYRWSVAALPRTGFEALLVFYHTLTTVNELREPLHDEVLATVFRVEGDRLTEVEESFGRDVLRGEFLPLKAATRRDDWVRAFRGRWFKHRGALEGFLRERQKSLLTQLQQRADAAHHRESEAATESYKYRLRELRDRSREQELSRLVKELVKEQAEAFTPALFPEYQDEATVRVQEIEEQMAVLRQDVKRTQELLTRERDHRLKVVLPRRFKVREVRVLPLALLYVVPAAAEDMRP
jgi:hypothetical protein